jgi:DNA-binding HxlR family transcriptional regulator
MPLEPLEKLVKDLSDERTNTLFDALRDGPKRNWELLKATGWSDAALARVITFYERIHAISHEEISEDRRAKLYYLTEGTKDFMDELRAFENEAQRIAREFRLGSPDAEDHLYEKVLRPMMKIFVERLGAEAGGGSANLDALMYLFFIVLGRIVFVHFRAELKPGTPTLIQRTMKVVGKMAVASPVTKARRRR